MSEKNMIAGASMLGGDCSEELRPLEEITVLADGLSGMNETISAYLTRFNGPEPVSLGEARDPARAPSCYRSEIVRLRRNVSEMGSLIDQLNRLG